MTSIATAQTVFWTVVLGRFVLPLLIPRWPLPAILACLFLDGWDQTVFHSLGLDPPFYQGYDKAMDVFYLAVAYLSTLRNWTSGPAQRISRFLFYFRLSGVVAFELSAWRPMLLIFPNTFEFFFIAYEAGRTRWNPARLRRKFWIAIAALIWIVIKLPQEYWIHVARLDFTATFAEVEWFRWVVTVGLLALLAVSWLCIRPRLAPPEHPFRIAPDPLPAEIDEADEWVAHIARYGRILSRATLEKVFLIGLSGVIFGSVLPGGRLTDLQLFLGIGLFVVLNAALSLWSARSRRRGIDSPVVNFAVVFAVNIGLVALFGLLLGRGRGEIHYTNAAFFVFLFSVLLTLYDRYHPIYEFRFREPASPSRTASPRAEGR
jgi:hypothetical protein